MNRLDELKSLYAEEYGVVDSGDSSENYSEASNAKKVAIGGASLYGGLGALLGKNLGGAKGAALGGLVGAGVGAFTGHAVGSNIDEYHADLEKNGAKYRAGQDKIVAELTKASGPMQAALNQLHKVMEAINNYEAISPYASNAWDDEKDEIGDIIELIQSQLSHVQAIKTEISTSQSHLEESFRESADWIFEDLIQEGIFSDYFDESFDVANELTESLFQEMTDAERNVIRARLGHLNPGEVTKIKSRLGHLPASSGLAKAGKAARKAAVSGAANVAAAGGMVAQNAKHAMGQANKAANQGAAAVSRGLSSIPGKVNKGLYNAGGAIGKTQAGVANAAHSGMKMVFGQWRKISNTFGKIKGDPDIARIGRQTGVTKAIGAVGSAANQARKGLGSAASAIGGAAGKAGSALGKAGGAALHGAGYAGQKAASGLAQHSGALKKAGKVGAGLALAGAAAYGVHKAVSALGGSAHQERIAKVQAAAQRGQAAGAALRKKAFSGYHNFRNKSGRFHPAS